MHRKCIKCNLRRAVVEREGDFLVAGAVVLVGSGVVDAASDRVPICNEKEPTKRDIPLEFNFIHALQSLLLDSCEVLTKVARRPVLNRHDPRPPAVRKRLIRERIVDKRFSTASQHSSRRESGKKSCTQSVARHRGKGAKRRGSEGGVKFVPEIGVWSLQVAGLA